MADKKRGHISILMMSYNHEKWLPETLDSLLSQLCQDFNLLIVDDASADGSVEVIRRYQDKFQNCQLIVNEKNKGVIDNFHYSLECMENVFGPAEFFVWVSPDDTLSPEYLGRAQDALNKNPQAVVCQSGYEMIYVGSDKRTEHMLESLDAQTYREACNVFLSHGSAEAKTHYNGMIQGLIRFSDLRALFPRDKALLASVLCMEISILIAMLLRGSMETIPDILYHRKKLGKFEEANPTDSFTLSRASLFFRICAVARCLPWFFSICENKKLRMAIPLLWGRLFYYYVCLFCYQKIKLALGTSLRKRQQ